MTTPGRRSKLRKLMTIVVTVEINDGIGLAADSATTFSDDKGAPVKIYDNANKVFNLVKGPPIGNRTWDAGEIGAASISTISKDLRRRFAGDDPDRAGWKLDPNTYTIELAAQKAREFIFAQHLAGFQVDKVPPRAGDERKLLIDAIAVVIGQPHRRTMLDTDIERSSPFGDSSTNKVATPAGVATHRSLYTEAQLNSASSACLLLRDGILVDKHDRPPWGDNVPLVLANIPGHIPPQPA